MMMIPTQFEIMSNIFLFFHTHPRVLSTYPWLSVYVQIFKLVFGICSPYAVIEEQAEPKKKKLQRQAKLVSCLTYSSTLHIEAACSS
jgi:hypothetical protein